MDSETTDAVMDDRPETTSAILNWVADYLDVSDALLGALCPGYDPGSDVQVDLRTIAAFLDSEPTIDSLIFSAVEAND